MGVKEGVPDCMSRFSLKYPGYQRFSPVGCFGETGPISRPPEMLFALVTARYEDLNETAQEKSLAPRVQVDPVEFDF